MTRNYQLTPTAQQALWRKDITTNAAFIPTSFEVEGVAKTGYNITLVSATDERVPLLSSGTLIRSLYAIRSIVEQLNSKGTSDMAFAFDSMAFGWSKEPMPGVALGAAFPSVSIDVQALRKAKKAVLKAAGKYIVVGHKTPPQYGEELVKMVPEEIIGIGNFMINGRFFMINGRPTSIERIDTEGKYGKTPPHICDTYSVCCNDYTGQRFRHTPQQVVNTLLHYAELAPAQSTTDMFETHELANVFSRCMQHELGKITLWKAVQENERRQDPTSCATHDYCDANMVMHEAVKILTGLDDHTVTQFIIDNPEIISKAWEGSIRCNFSLSTPAPQAKQEIRDCFIVLTELVNGGTTAAWSNEDGQLLFDTEAEAQAEINDVVTETANAVNEGNMDEGYSADDFVIVPCKVLNPTDEPKYQVLAFTVPGSDTEITMLRGDEDFE